MNLFKSTSAIAVLFLGVTCFTACSPKDEDVQKSVKEELVKHDAFTHVTVIKVVDGKVELKGHVTSDADKAAAAADVAKVKGVKSVDNDIAVTPATADAMIDHAQDKAADPNDPILLGAKKALKDYPGVTSEVKDGEITISGDVSKDEEKAILERLHVLKARKVNNNLNVVKDAK